MPAFLSPLNVLLDRFCRVRLPHRISAAWCGSRTLHPSWCCSVNGERTTVNVFWLRLCRAVLLAVRSFKFYQSFSDIVNETALLQVQLFGSDLRVLSTRNPKLGTRNSLLLRLCRVVISVCSVAGLLFFVPFVVNVFLFFNPLTTPPSIQLPDPPGRCPSTVRCCYFS